MNHHGHVLMGGSASAEFTAGRLLPCRLSCSESVCMGHVRELVRLLELDIFVHNMVYVHTEPHFLFSIFLKEDVLKLA